MKWSWKIAKVAGIEVSIHATFLLLLGWIGISAWMTDRSLASVGSNIGFILALFGCVLLHELGHALTARKYGIKTRDITLLPIGGVARLERMPEEPRQELQVALAGPLVNVVITILLLAVLFLTGGITTLADLNLQSSSFLVRLTMVNLSLALFNLIPAFPMDGGRVVRALLATRMEYTRATQTAATLGQLIAFGLGFIGLFSNPFLIFIALFVWIGAAQESSMVQVKSALGGIPVNRAMLTNFVTLAPTDRLQTAVDQILAGTQQDFPVVLEGRVVGILTRQALMAGLSRDGAYANVASAMQREFETADSIEMLDVVAQRLREQPLHTMPVVHNGELVGLVTMDNVGEFLMIQTALEQSRAQRPQAG
ncbi:MAG TPA: site-2 protease family protein [Anaerolineaceae bacterium]|nr:site-2 protease family protein [Anaerolineaceae bacterium]HPA34071.1 site-2 protease family protein [Anaerolineaceae bacterium]HQP61794.1 site-2 protease family protein [Anaerolineaceae bacterium]